MEKNLTIGEAAKAVHMTAETLRHYDRIGLVQPSVKDPWTRYRYYSPQDLIRLHTVRALQQMDLPLEKIKEVLGYADLQQIVHFLAEAERTADKKIAALQYSKAKIQAARADYEKKLQGAAPAASPELRTYAPRVLLLSPDLAVPTLDNLWDYLSHFYDHIPSEQRDLFQFEDVAGIYMDGTHTCMYAVCLRYAPITGLRLIPGGQYLCLSCTEENRAQQTAVLRTMAQEQYRTVPDFVLQQIVVSGILHWAYQVQVWIDPANSR